MLMTTAGTGEQAGRLAEVVGRGIRNALRRASTNITKSRARRRRKLNELMEREVLVECKTGNFVCDQQGINTVAYEAVRASTRHAK